MANIVSAEIINSYVSTEGSNGFMTNYVYYTVLVHYSNGSVSLVDAREGSGDMNRLLPYVRSSYDVLASLKEDISALRGDVNKIQSNLNSIVDQKMAYIIDSLYPIPSVLGMGETEALRLIREANLIPVLKNTYPAGTPATGVVKDYRRDKDNFKKVVVDIIHSLPDVSGMEEQEAKNVLAEAGFNVAETVRQIVPGRKDGTVYQCTRNSDASMRVTLTLCSAAVDFTGMTENEAMDALQQRGFTANTRYDYNARPEGTVYNWENAGGSRVILCISKGPAVKNFGRRPVNVSSAESPTDSCKAEVKMNRKDRYWDVTLFYSSGSKHDRSIVGVQMKTTGAGTNATVVSEPIIRSIADNRIVIKIPTRSDDSNASSLSFTLNTCYGTFSRKTDDINVTIDLSNS